MAVPVVRVLWSMLPGLRRSSTSVDVCKRMRRRWNRHKSGQTSGSHKGRNGPVTMGRIHTFMSVKVALKSTERWEESSSNNQPEPVCISCRVGGWGVHLGTWQSSS